MSARTFLVILVACAATAATAQDTCPYLPEFKVLRPKLDAMPLADAVAALQSYVAEHDSPNACEYFEIDRLLSDRETKLVKLVFGGKELPAQLVFRCDRFNPKTAQCQSPMEDGTAQYADVGVVPTTVLNGRTAFEVVSNLPGAHLQALYRTSISNALDGRPAKRLGNVPLGKWRASHEISVLIAIYRTTGPWAYRKAVWYFQ